MVISAETPKVTLAELQTIYGTEDLENFIEVIRVNAHNQRAMMKKR